MTNPRRVTIKPNDFDGSMYTEKDVKGSWIFDPDCKIDVSKYQAEAQPKDAADTICADCGYTLSQHTVGRRCGGFTHR